MNTPDTEKIDFIKKQSSKIIENVLNNCDIYHVSSFKPEYISCESSGPHKTYSSKIRWDFLYGNYGFISTVNNFSSQLVRFCEYISFGDFPKALRHKINMVGDLIAGDMNSFVPIHVTLSPYKSIEKEIDIETLATDYLDYEMVIHPGHTRGVGSVFLNTPLKNALIYINKEHKLKIKQTNAVQKINNETELLKHYTPLFKSTNLVYDFKIHKGNVREMVKVHKPTNTPVLKVNNIIDGNNFNSEKPKQLHHTNFYKSITFESFDNFCKILFSNKIKLYTDKGYTNRLYNKFLSNAQKLQDSYFGTEFKHIPSKHSLFNGYEKIDTGTLLNSAALFNTKDTTDLKYNNIWEQTFNTFSETFNNNKKSFNLDNSELLGGCKIEELDNIKNKDLVKDNDYSGVIIYVSKDMIKKLDRLFYELLYCVHFKVSIAQTKCKGLRIINCSHPSWNQLVKSKEIILNDRFLSYD